jgi:hypothetical protein
LHKALGAVSSWNLRTVYPVLRGFSGDKLPYPARSDPKFRFRYFCLGACSFSFFGSLPSGVKGNVHADVIYVSASREYSPTPTVQCSIVGISATAIAKFQQKISAKPVVIFIEALNSQEYPRSLVNLGEGVSYVEALRVPMNNSTISNRSGTVVKVSDQIVLVQRELDTVLI